MKKLKFTNVGTLLLLVAISSMVVLSSCKEDPAPVVVDFSALDAKITEAETLISTTEEGTAAGQYSRGSQAVLQTAIDAAKIVADDTESTQTAVDNTVIALQAAIDVYNGSIIEAIDPDNLVGHWTFDEGDGTTVADYSGNGFDGTFKTGHASFGGGTPAWGTDRYGNANHALSVNEGAFVEVPYNASLNPATITISVWVNAAEILENNRFLGLHSWNGYKFQLQSANKSFFTINSSDGIYDNDTDPALNVEEWYHLAVTFGDGEMVFYIDGTETNRVVRTGTAMPVTGHNLAIGVGSSQYADTDTNYDVDKIIPAAWGGYFHGLIDELRIYKTVLTPTQIESIYNLEKP